MVAIGEDAVLVRRLLKIVRMQIGCGTGVAGLVFLLLAPGTTAASDLRQQLIAVADKIFTSHAVSYVYGGRLAKGARDCRPCNQCLSQKRPRPEARLSECPACQTCSLDCSHFTQLVFRSMDWEAPYLTTTTMLRLSAQKLIRRYALYPMGRDVPRTQAGDLLVYQGHVVLLMKKHDAFTGDIMHATSGRDLQGPGQGVQLERRVSLGQFRGPLRRVLRHRRLVWDDQARARQRYSQGPSRGVGAQRN